MKGEYSHKNQNVVVRDIPRKDLNGMLYFAFHAQGGITTNEIVGCEKDTANSGIGWQKITEGLSFHVEDACCPNAVCDCALGSYAGPFKVSDNDCWVCLLVDGECVAEKCADSLTAGNTNTVNFDKVEFGNGSRIVIVCCDDADPAFECPVCTTKGCCTVGGHK
jgi:hypothetical protein